MKAARWIALAALVITIGIAVPAAAGDYEADTDGPWVNVDVVDLASYGDATYLDYLGKGYVVMLEKVKAEGLILDYGVMLRVTGNVADGDVIIWWSVASLADYEKVGARMGEISDELHTSEEWQEIWAKLDKVRTIKSSNFYRAVSWTKAEEE